MNRRNFLGRAVLVGAAVPAIQHLTGDTIGLAREADAPLPELATTAASIYADATPTQPGNPVVTPAAVETVTSRKPRGVVRRLSEGAAEMVGEGMKATATHFSTGAVRVASRHCPDTPSGTGYHVSVNDDYGGAPFARTDCCGNCGLVWGPSTRWTNDPVAPRKRKATA